MVNNELFDPLVLVAGESVWERYGDGRLVWHASPCRDTLGFDEMFAAGTLSAFIARLHPDDVTHVHARLDSEAAAPGVAWIDEYRLRRDDGIYVTLAIRGYTLPPGSDPSGPLTVGTARDVTAERENERKLGAAVDYADALIDSIPGAFYHVDRESLLMLRWNSTFREITGYSDEELATMTAGEFFGADEQDQVRSAIDDIFVRGHGQVSAGFLCKDGTRKPYFFTGRPYLHEGRDSYVGVAVSMDEQVALQQQLRHAATHDALTGLANRSLLHEELGRAIEEAAAGGHRVAVLDLDLDRFKVVNDGFGHPYGDKVIQAVAHRLRALVCLEDTVARMGGDEFVILAPLVHRYEDIHEMSQRLVDSFSEPFVVEERQIHLTGSIGVSFYPRDGLRGAELIDNADMAMYYAKAAGRSAFRVFAPVMAEEAQRRTDMETHLRTAAADGQLWLAFQPKVDLASGTVTGCEALLRWNHPERGPIPPSEFIPVAEESGMILQIGEWVLEEACRQGRAWLDEGLAPLSIAVNISAAQLLQPDPVGWVKATLARTGFPAELLELELTESQLSQDVETTIRVIRGLRDLGVTIAIDDFGTGYSSLEYLRRFDVTSLKIDRSFVDGMLAESSDEAIVRAAIALGGAFGISVTAEGVETEAQQRFLAELRCDAMQGYLVSKPVPPMEFADLLTDGWTTRQ
ncbi:putative bifunctional diguanylate cyclase/phosphodiesterase [Nocardioides nematodiphilus]|uniref:putative bifunctional diguanylate cyclase/phosphodiesterase n=1 Tax=Nocardioides nematodiphilus TaxID=2849669 RepID=UPI001CDA4A87|nr:bifunctional diguanylate cyclase/phosphodiesterase [Nocardioides nematodiphilus]MCA1984393.1 EAL domain-containing protein [Nocardioides nematodiphilus]